MGLVMTTIKHWPKDQSPNHGSIWNGCGLIFKCGITQKEGGKAFGNGGSHFCRQSTNTIPTRRQIVA